MTIQIDIDETINTAQVVYSKDMDKFLQVVIIPQEQIDNEKAQLQAKLDILNVQSDVQVNLQAQKITP